MKLVKSAHFGAQYDVDAAKRLRLDVAHPTTPWHEELFAGRYGQLRELGAQLPLLVQLSDMRRLYSEQEIRNALALKQYLKNWWIIGNEGDLPWFNTPAQTPAEYADMVAKNASVVWSMVRDARLILSLGSKMAWDGEPCWAERVLVELATRYPGALQHFDAIATNYYALPLDGRKCAHWLRDRVRGILVKHDLARMSVWLKEVGAGAERQTMDEAVEFINLFFKVVGNHPGQYASWLELVGWYAVSDLSAYQMQYVPLLEGKTLTPAGKAWAGVHSGA